MISATCLIVAIVSATSLRAEPAGVSDDWMSSPSGFLATPSSLFEPGAATVAHREALPQFDQDVIASDDITHSTSEIPSMPGMPQSLSADLQCDRFWLINTRHLTCNTCRMNLNQPNFHVSRLNRCGQRLPSSMEDYLSSMDSTRPRIIYIHGNRRDASTAISQGLFVYHQVARNRPVDQPIDWVIWSWPSDASSIFLSDVRDKAQRTNSQGLYVAWLLREHLMRSQPSGLIGFSFGGRIVTGSLHALAGGSLGRRTIGEPAITGANIDVGLLAPAVDSRWLCSGAEHGLATQNMNRLVLFYNHRDIALKYFKLISKNPMSQALGYTGPRYFAPRHDGTPLLIRAHDCSSTVGNHHSEKRYYEHSCCAGREMASLVKSVMVVD
ncbi:alpha/beta hydrolase family protein [Aporhodopirellula aestuarii]|uniref:Alpha/beta hydrolase n=1 Tax=Aporhodopirellula aestuarii TaxID=2950107 RepID=A0ABT0UB62_9BACT|nr:alpha/beta hydrolase [Aporhodopirellula aestuarii]MCM2374016.1 alpha/beta hydrolase [Aporhodopirellula aestuarii]